MITNVLIGCATMVVCIILQCLVVALMLVYLRNRDAAQRMRATFAEAARLLTVAMLILMLGHLVQIAVWAGLFQLLGEFSDFQTAYYHSSVNFATLGYGDIVMSERRRLLGGLEAANGVLMFGLTTSALYATIQALSHQVMKQHRPHSAAWIPGGDEQVVPTLGANPESTSVQSGPRLPAANDESHQPPPVHRK